jgi:hypothetical protein
MVFFYKASGTAGLKALRRTACFILRFLHPPGAITAPGPPSFLQLP